MANSINTRLAELERRMTAVEDAANDALDLLGVNDEGVEDDGAEPAIDILEADDYPATPDPVVSLADPEGDAVRNVEAAKKKGK